MKLTARDIIHPYGGIPIRLRKMPTKNNKAILGIALMDIGFLWLVNLLKGREQ